MIVRVIFQQYLNLDTFCYLFWNLLFLYCSSFVIATLNCVWNLSFIGYFCVSLWSYHDWNRHPNLPAIVVSMLCTVEPLLRGHPDERPLPLERPLDEENLNKNVLISTPDERPPVLKRQFSEAKGVASLEGFHCIWYQTPSQMPKLLLWFDPTNEKQ